MKRSAPLRRTPFNRGPVFMEPRPEREARLVPLLQPVARTGVYAPSAALVAAVPKGPQAKPGKRAPTAEEKRWLDAIVAHGCIACLLDGLPQSLVSSQRPAVHHILRGGQRLGHLYSLPLCDPGHHQGGLARGLVSRHPYKARFEATYGCEQTLLNGLQRKLGFPVLTWQP